MARSLDEVLRRTCLPAVLVVLSADLTNPGAAEAEDARDYAGPVIGAVLPRDSAGGAAEDAAIAARRFPETLQKDAIFRFARGDEPVLLDWCWRRLSRLLEHATEAFARSQLALSVMRAREQELSRSLEQVEAAYEHFRVEPCKLALSLAPSGVYLGPPASPAATLVVRQRVKLRLINVAYLDLFFPRAGAGLSGELDLTVAMSHSRTTICECRLSFAAIRRGWNRFACSGGDLRASEPQEFMLRLSGRDWAEMLPALAEPSPIAEDCAATDEGPATRPLALQIWCGIPGVRYLRQSGAHGGAAPDDRPATQLGFAVPIDTFARTRPHAVPPVVMDFAPIAYDAATQSLLVHPLGVEPTVAKVPRLDVEELTAVSVLVSLRNRQAQPTEFAIQVVEAASRMAAAGARADQPRWLLLHPGEWGELHCDLPRPVSGAVDILLMTRNRAENYQLSWAYFRGLRLLCGGEGTAGL